VQKPLALDPIEILEKPGKVPEREILRFNFLKNELFFNVWINNFDLLHQFGHHPVDSALGLVQGLYEEVPNVGHQVCEAEETIGLGVLYKVVKSYQGAYFNLWHYQSLLFDPLDHRLTRVRGPSRGTWIGSMEVIKVNYCTINTVELDGLGIRKDLFLILGVRRAIKINWGRVVSSQFYHRTVI